MLLLMFAVAFVVTFGLIPSLISISKTYHIYDLPEERKIHSRPISFLGGIALFFGFYLAFGLLYPIDIPRPMYTQVMWICIFGTFLVGLGDDFFDYRPSLRFLVQFFFGTVIILKGGMVLAFHEILPFLQYIPYSDLLMTVVVFSAITNAYNLIDGMDGLAATLSLFGVVAYFLVFRQLDLFFFEALAITLCGSLLAFLWHNRPPARIFMGDSGSYFLGFMLAIFTVRFISPADATHTMPVNDRFQIGFALVSIPALDMVRLFLVRLSWRKSPFVADNNHLHHLLLSSGLGPIQT
ncbi:MAG: glycosyltransferase family 4 protein, partial [Bacteroidota bacterium]